MIPRRACPRRGGDRLDEEVEQRATLQPACLGDREHPLGKALAGLRLAAEGDLAVDHRASQSALGAVVGRLDAVDLGEGPKRRLELQQVAGEGAKTAVEGALLAMGLQQGPQPALDGSDLAGQALAVAVGGEGLPSREQLATGFKALLPEAALIGKAFGVAAEVAQEVRPADLAAGRVQGVMGPPAIGGGDAGEALADQLGQLALVAGGGNVKGGEVLVSAPHRVRLHPALRQPVSYADDRGVLDRLAHRA